MYANSRRKSNTSRHRAAKGRRRRPWPEHTNDAQGRLTPLFVLARHEPEPEPEPAIPPVRGGSPSTPRSRSAAETACRLADIEFGERETLDALRFDLYGC